MNTAGGGVILIVLRVQKENPGGKVVLQSIFARQFFHLRVCHNASLKHTVYQGKLETSVSLKPPQRDQSTV